MTKVALVHDWLTGMRGGERVLERIAALYPGAPIHTLVWKRGSVSPAIESHPIVTSFLQRLPDAERRYRWFLPLFPRAVESFDLSGFDVVVSTSHAVAKSAITAPGTFHLSYVFTPMRYVWDLEQTYFPPGRFPWPLSWYVSRTCARLRAWDRATSRRPDALLADSRHVAERIRRHWGREAEVLYPPVDVDRFRVRSAPVAPGARRHFLLAGAFAPYKRADLALETCARLGHRVLVTGAGPEEPRLRRLAPPETEFRGWVGDDEIGEVYANARALLYPGEEDFGIIPVEALASGTPVIAFGRGGALETVGCGASPEALARVATGGVARVPGGVLFGTQTTEGLAAAIELFEHEGFEPAGLRALALPFAAAEFDRNFREALERAHATWRAGAAAARGRTATPDLPAPDRAAAPQPAARPAGRSISANSATLLAAQVLIKLIGLALAVLLARSFSVERYGRFTFAFTYAALFAPLVDLGMDFYVTRAVVREPGRAAAYLGSSLALKTALALIVLPLALGAGAALGYPPPVQALIALALVATWLAALGGSYTAVFRAKQRMDLEAITSVAGRAGALALSAAAIAAGRGLAAVTVAQGLGSLFALGLAAAAAARRATRPLWRAARTLWRELLAGGLPFALTAILVLVYFRIDTLMLQRMKGEHSVGIYGAAVTLLYSALLLSQALVTAVFPVIARARSLAEPAAREVMRRALTLSLAASLPLALGTAATARPLLHTLYGERYAVGATSLTLLMATLPLLFVTNLFGHCLGALGRQRTVLAVASANAALNVALNLWLIPRWDYDGASLATLLTEVLGLSLFLVFLRRDLRAAIHLSGLGKVLALNALLGVALLLMRGQPWLATVAVAVTLYGLLLWLTRLVTPADLRTALLPFTGRRES